jgi:predicted helicase
MVESGREPLSRIKRIDQLIAYLRDKLDWPIESDNIEEITYDYTPDELGIDSKNAAKIETIKQLMPLSTNQPWGIFFVKFERKRLPVVALRRILGQLVIKKRASSRKSDKPSWLCNDLLFISSYGEEELRQISLAHFTEDKEIGDLPTLKVLGWDGHDTNLHLTYVADELYTKLHWPENERELEAWREQWASAFTTGHREVITTSKQLAVRLAALARIIRSRVNAILAVESEKGKLKKLMATFKQSLIHDLSEDDFADMYAQTIAYGLLSARVSRPTGIVADNIADMIPITNPFLRELLETFLSVGGRNNFIDFDELGINDVVEMLRTANMEAILRDFGRRARKDDPVFYFYEDFIYEYDAKKRRKRGIYFTPPPVVSFIVRSVDETLRKEFGLKDGLSDTTTWGEMIKRNPEIKLPRHAKLENPFVQILDPATGTGTFLVEVIDLIHKTMTSKWKSQGNSDVEIIKLWNDYVPKHLLPRLYGFELMMAPYTIAHMKLGLKLYETGYTFSSNERARVYLTNSLEEPNDFSELFDLMAPALAHEVKAANRVKQRALTSVIIGNPPYAGHSANASIDHNGKPTFIGKIIRSYYEVDGKPLGEKNPKWLQDDYVKFMRYAQWRIQGLDCGIISFITNHGYLDNPTFRGMRHQLINTFDQINVVDLHGNAKKKEVAPDGSKDENVFDIQQGVSMALLTKNKEDRSKVYYSQIWGLREGKYDWLIRNNIKTIKMQQLSPKSEFYFFIPRDEKKLELYQRYMKITDIFSIKSVGVLTARDKLTIKYTPDEVWKTVQNFSTINADLARSSYNLGKDARDWKVVFAQKDLINSGLDKRKILQILYRPFDVRYTYYTGNSRGFHCMPRSEVMTHMIQENLGFITARSNKSPSPNHFFISDKITEIKCGESTICSYLFPLYLYPSPNNKNPFDPSREHCKKKSNLHPELLNKLRETYGNEVTPEEIFYYIYGTVFSNIYRIKYSEFLKLDFPRIPFANDFTLFQKISDLGKKLANLHLLQTSVLDRPVSKCLGEGLYVIEKLKYNEKEERVYINNGQYFDGIQRELWEYQIGGYQVLDKWLKSRKGETLTNDDITHYCKIVTAIKKTIELQKGIDNLYLKIEEGVLEHI